MPTRTSILTRQRLLPEAGGGTIHFKLQAGRLGRFLQQAEVPEFEGEEAIVEWQMEAGRPHVLRIVRVMR